MKTNMISNKEFKNWNEEMVKKYDQDVYYTRSPLPIRVIERLRIKKIIKMISPSPFEKVVEVGCGTGNVIKEIKKGNVIGIDISLSLLKKAQNKVNSSVNFIEANAESIPLKDNSISKVICTEVLEHVLYPGAVLNEIERILLREGIVVISVPNESLINKLKAIFFSSRLLRYLFLRKSVIVQPLNFRYRGKIRI